MESLEQIIGYNFKNKNLLKNALTHPSANKKRKEIDYERLEFVGDSILSLIISETLYNLYPKEREGALAKRRAAIVCKQSLAEIAKQINLGQFLILGVGEDQSGGRQNNANLENSLEALIAAIYFDNGLVEVRKFVDKFFNDLIKGMKSPPKDPKSKLQEWAQSNSLPLPQYEIVSISGPSHEPEIKVELSLEGKNQIVTASSRKEAERVAAQKLIEELNID